MDIKLKGCILRLNEERASVRGSMYVVRALFYLLGQRYAGHPVRLTRQEGIGLLSTDYTQEDTKMYLFESAVQVNTPDEALSSCPFRRILQPLRPPV